MQSIIVPVAFCVIANAAPSQAWSLNSGAGLTIAAEPAIAQAPNGQLVLFGGVDTSGGPAGVVSNQTWLYNGTWTQANPSVVPPARIQHALCFDSNRNVTVLFGGRATHLGAPLGDAWEWDGANWTQVTVPSTLTARANTAMAFDSARNVVVLFSGGCGPTTANDTWEYDGTNWSLQTPSNAPTPRGSHAMAYDPTRGGVVLFGGTVPNDCVYGLNDLWLYDGLDWTQLQPPESPQPRSNHRLTFDPGRATLVMTGGQEVWQFYETWELRGNRWFRYQTSLAPARVEAMCYHPSSQRMVATARSVGSPLSTWEWGGQAAATASYGEACTGPDLLVLAPPQTGSSLRISHYHWGATLGLLVGGNAEANIPVPGTSCRLAVAPPLIGVSVQTGSNYSIYDVPIPSNPALAGVEVFFQSAGIGPQSALTISNGIRATIF